MRSFLIMAMIAAGLDAALSSAAATGRAQTLLAMPTQILDHILDATLPAIPDLRGTPDATTAAATTASNIFDLQQQQGITASWTTAAQAAPVPTNNPTGDVSV
jgi:ABC-type branched-subunit amino acid transport system permease subunit